MMAGLKIALVPYRGEAPAMTDLLAGQVQIVFTTPAEIIDKLNRETNAALAEPKLKAQLANFGTIVMTGSPADFGKFIASEIDKWAKVVKFANIKPE